MTRTLVGDLVKFAAWNYFDVVVHGCNCFHTMGVGVALSLARRFPEVIAADKLTALGDSSKLGTYSVASIKRKEKPTFVILNAYTQFRTASYPGEIAVDYEAVEAVFKKIKQDFSGSRIAYPKIGAGLAGGDWVRLSRIIDDALVGENHTLVVLQ